MINSKIFKEIIKPILLFVVVFICVYGIIKLYRWYQIKDYEETFAIYIGREGAIGNPGDTFRFNTKDGSTVDSNPYHYLNEKAAELKLKKGDTVWIKYAVNDPHVTILVSTDYKKYMKE